MKKYITVLFDGMADRPDERGLTPMAEAKKPTTDKLAALGEVGLVQTVPAGMKPGSDVANLAALGYDPEECYTGRSPLEALSMGIALGESDVTFRVNLVTLSDAPDFNDRIMLDYSAGEISTAEAAELVDSLKPLFAADGLELYAGISYRHAAVLRGAGRTGVEFTPPHDITNKRICGHAPAGYGSHMFSRLIMSSTDILKNHPINASRIKSGKRPANAVWFWGEGTRPALAPFEQKFGKRGAVISAVDLVKGIGVGGKMNVIDVPGATGTVDTDYAAKLNAAINALKTNDYLFAHFEGPDECGHQGDRAGKILAIERIDKLFLRPLLESLKADGTPFAVAVMPDHATPLCVRTHTGEPVPYLIYDSEREANSGVTAFTEETAATTGILLSRGAKVIEKLFSV